MHRTETIKTYAHMYGEKQKIFTYLDVKRNYIRIFCHAYFYNLQILVKFVEQCVI